MIRDQNDRKEKDKLKALVQEVRGQVLFKKILTNMQDAAHDKLGIGYVQDRSQKRKHSD